jgi:hypothetical protein
MDQKSNPQRKGYKSTPELIDKDDSRTIERQHIVRDKLKNICGPNQNVDDLLNSLETYCLIILQSLK